MRAPKGFTAIEIAVTVVIAGILASLAVASVGPLLENRRMREAAQQIEQTIRKAQQLARTKDQTTYIKFNSPGRTSKTYTLFAGQPCSIVASTVINTGSLDQNMQILGTTLDYGTCPNGNTNLNILAFDNQGKLANTGGASSVGQCIGIDDSTQDNATQSNQSGYLVCVMTASGDVSTFQVSNITAGVPY